MPYGYYADPGNTTGAPANNETYIQRQQRLQSKSASASQPVTTKPAFQPSTSSGSSATYQPAGGTGTPVSGAGKIPEPAPAAPAPAPAPAPTPMTVEQREAAVGIKPGPGTMVVLANGAMVDRNHPLYFDELAKAPTTQAAPAAGGGAAATPVGAPGSATGGAAEASKGVFTQYAAPEHDFQNWQQLELVSQLLAKPETMSPEVIEMQKQKSMEEALLFQQQLQQQQQDELASRGFSLNGGAADAGRRKTNDAITSAILGQNRDYEIQAATQNRQDQLQALGVAESILGGQVGRAGDVFGNVLAGQQANRDDLWKGKQLDLQRELGVGGLNIDQQRVGNQNRQFDASQGLNILQFLESQRQHNNSLGYNYNALNANQQSQMMQSILNSIGG